VPSIKPTKNGYRAQVYVNGIRDSKTKRTLKEAKAWASARENELRDQANMPAGDLHTLGDALIRHRNEVSIKKRGVRWEQIRIEAFLRDAGLPIKLKMSQLTSEHFAKWRDIRLRSVSKGTVLREFGMLSAVFEVARTEWKWIKENPIKDVKKPANPPHRDVLLTRREIKAQLRALDYSPLRPIRSFSHASALTFLIALRTGMRAGEICGLEWSRVFSDHCKLLVTKTTPRDVPFVASKVNRLLNKAKGIDRTFVVGISTQTLDALFRKARKKAGLSGFTFHDSRHYAATQLSQMVDMLTLCKIMGWKDPKHALVYYNPTASMISKMLSRKHAGASN